MLFDVFGDNFSIDFSYTGYEESYCPKTFGSPIYSFEVFVKFFSHDIGAFSFYVSNYRAYGFVYRKSHVHMNMILFESDFKNDYSYFLTSLSQDYFQSFLHFFTQSMFSVFCYPYEMISEIVGGMTAFLIYHFTFSVLGIHCLTV